MQELQKDNEELLRGHKSWETKMDSKLEKVTEEIVNAQTIKENNNADWPDTVIAAIEGMRNRVSRFEQRLEEKSV
jgi:hypothetical protein